MRLRFVNAWKALPAVAGWSFSLFNLWHCRYAGGGQSWGFLLFNVGLELTLLPASHGQPANMGQNAQSVREAKA